MLLEEEIERCDRQDEETEVKTIEREWKWKRKSEGSIKKIVLLTKKRTIGGGAKKWKRRK